MSDYIKKNVLLEAIRVLTPDASEYECAHDSRAIKVEDVENNAYWAARDMFDDVMTVIEDATPADVAPVVHGKWLNNFGNYYRMCSVCAGVGYGSFNFCPNCGAKMDESEGKQ